MITNRLPELVYWCWYIVYLETQLNLRIIVHNLFTHLYTKCWWWFGVYLQQHNSKRITPGAKTPGTRIEKPDTCQCFRLRKCKILSVIMQNEACPWASLQCISWNTSSDRPQQKTFTSTYHKEPRKAEKAYQTWLGWTRNCCGLWGNGSQARKAAVTQRA